MGKNEHLKKRILLLEDDTQRVWRFRSELGLTHHIKWTDTAQACIHSLEHDDWDILFLDHDLGGEVYVDESDKNTGSEVARWLVQARLSDEYAHFKDKVKFIVIHSLNHPAAHSMLKSLQDVGYRVIYIPFISINWDALSKELEREWK